ncbi:MAG TPA: LysR family transcriptional regulator [Gemmatimonadales bacterium]|nr:LysR family transcriptional regulator [Gemmatimonadales bacterium]
MELYQLRSFAAVAETGHLTRAAEKLHISQPALSAQIKALEDELGVALFERTSSGMTLTSGGQRLLAEAGKVLAAAQLLRNEARSLKGEVAGKASVGTVLEPDLSRVGEFLSVMVERHPLLQLELHHEISGAALEKVRDGALDASFFYGELTQPSVAGLALRPLVYRVAAPAAWRGRIAGAGWPDVAALPWVLTPPISSHNRLASALFRKHGVEPTKVVEADQESVISSLVASGVGLSLMREDVALEREAAGEICLWDQGRATTTLWFIHLHERAEDPVIRALLEGLRDTWALQEEPVAPLRGRAARR